QPHRAALEDGPHDCDLELLRQSAERLRRGTGNRLGEFELGVIFGLAEVEAAKELGQADDVRAPLRRVADSFRGRRQVPDRIGAAAHLHESDFERRRGHRGGRYRMEEGRATKYAPWALD